MTSQYKSMVNAQYRRPIFLLTCERRLYLSKFFSYSKHENLLPLSSAMKLGQGLKSISNTLQVPRTRLASYRDRVYSNIVPRLWNSLPEDLRQMHNITLLQQKLIKTHLFMFAFPTICQYFLTSTRLAL